MLYDDEARIRETVPGVVLTVPARMTRRVARLNERQLEMRVVETVPDWFAVVQRPVLAGRTLAPNDLLMRANVCVLTEHGVRRLLAAEHMVGQRIRISSGVFEVIGIVKNETGGTVRAQFLLGWSPTREGCREALAEWGSGQARLGRAREKWEGLLSRIAPETGDAIVDQMLGRWLPAQALAGRVWGRVGGRWGLRRGRGSAGFFRGGVRRRRGLGF